MRKNIFESEEEARELFDMIFPELSPDGYLIGITRDAKKQLTWNNLKQAGIIQPNAYEELMEYVEKIICVSTKDMDKDNSGLKHLIQAYHDEKHSLSQEVKEAREKTDKLIDNLALHLPKNRKNNGYEYIDKDCLKLSIQSERQIVDAMIKEKE